MIIFRYLFREVYGTLLASTIVLLILLISNQAVHFLTQAAAGVLPLQTVIQLILLQTPLLLSILLPLGLYIGILVAYGRLYSDNEMTVLWSCGFSKARLIGITLVFSILTMMLVCALTLWFQPRIETHKRALLTEAAAASPLERMLPDQFVPLPAVNLVFYTEGLSRNHKELKQVFVAKHPDTEVGPQFVQEKKDVPWDIIVAQSGYQMLDPVTKDRFLVLQDGHRYTGIPGQMDFQIASYKTYGVRIEKHPPTTESRADTEETIQLWKERHHNPLSQAELQWRISLPLSVLILSLLAVPLSRVEPRQGRYGSLLPAFLIYIIYLDLLFVSRAWLEKGQIHTWLGLWWVHVLILLIALGYLKRFMGWRLKA